MIPCSLRIGDGPILEKKYDFRMTITTSSAKPLYSGSEYSSNAQKGGASPGKPLCMSLYDKG